VGRIHAAVQTAFASFFPNYNPTTGISEFANSGGNTFGGQFPGDYRIPYSMQFNAGVQRELAKNTVISIDYVRIRGVGLPFMLVDNERRRDAAFFNEAAARSSIGTRIGVAPGAVNPQTIQNFINARTAGGLSTTIATFSLANDTIWPGVSDLVRARLIQGGFSLYNGLQIQLNGRFGQEGMSFLSIGDRRLVQGMDYTISYALSKAEATSGSGRQEFITNTSFGPTANDRTHLFGAGLIIGTIGGFNFNPTFRFGSAPPVTLTVPFTDTFAGANNIFTTDLNGDGGTGTSARGDVLPGTNIGDFGSKIGSWAELNRIIAQFNTTTAGTLTPHAQRLLQAGIFSEAQLKALGAVVKPIALVPENNPWPFQGRFNADLRVTRPISIKERIKIEPYLEVFNLFNNTPKGTYGGLNHRVFGNLNFPYATADIGDLDSQVRGLLQNPRQFQFGIRGIF
jgi:hypothetical protein